MRAGVMPSLHSVAPGSLVVVRDEEWLVTQVGQTRDGTLITCQGRSELVAGRWCLVAEKERWPEGRWLAVDLQLVCERNDNRRGGEIDRALTIPNAASLAPGASGTTWWRETLQDSSRHTVGVSKDLREGVRLSTTFTADKTDCRKAVYEPGGLVASGSRCR